MKFLYQAQNIGIYIEESDVNWQEQTIKLLEGQFAGFEIFDKRSPIEYRLIVCNHNKLNIPDKTIIVPENTYYLPDGTIVHFERNIAYRIETKDIYFYVKGETWFAPYLLDYIFQKQGKTFVHGASISTEVNGQRKGILLVAFGGIGKTCFVSQALQRDQVKLLGDDLIILDSDGKLCSYPRPFCLYKYHKQLFPDYFSKHKMKIYNVKSSNYFLRGCRKIKRILGMKLKQSSPYMMVPPVEIFNKDKMELEAVPLEKLYLLRRVKGIDKIQCKTSDCIEEAVNFAQNIILHEWEIGFKILLNKKAQGFESIAEYILTQRDIIKSCLQHVSEYQLVDIPEGMQASEVSKELDQIIMGV